MLLKVNLVSLNLKAETENLRSGAAVLGSFVGADGSSTCCAGSSGATCVHDSYLHVIFGETGENLSTYYLSLKGL